MKKIGVITWFRYNNYGTVLQAGALQNYLRSKNTISELIEVPFYDLDKSNEKLDLVKLGGKIIGHLKTEYISFTLKKELAIRKNKFHNFIYDNFAIKKVNNNFQTTCNEFDLLICGSDQIWNPNWFNDFYFANFPDITTPKISYAPSIGVKHLPDYLIGSYYNSLKKFKYLSVREKNAQNEIQNNLGLNCSTVLDPIFLLNREKWSKLIDENICNDYILCYMLGNNKNHWKAIHKYAKEHNLKLKIIPMKSDSYFQKGEIIKDAGPLEFLKYISNAKVVLTDSFHACAFSIIFNRPFYVFERTSKMAEKSQNSRIYNLLDLSGLQKRLVKYNKNTIDDKERIDYKLVSLKMKPFISKSMNFLDRAIDEI